MGNPTLTLVPSGGLANRMRAIVSAAHLCATIGGRLSVVWFGGWGLRARFADIFEPVPAELMTLRDATWLDHLVNDRPRRHNLWLPALPQRVAYRHRISEQHVTPLKQRGFDFERWAAQGRCYMSCYQEFGQAPTELYARIFRPAPAVRHMIDANVRRFEGRTIGLHIRRTDSAESIAKSPTSLFVDAARREIESHGRLTIFLATDDEGVKSEMRAAFGSRVITAEAAASRDSVDGIRHGLADMYTLAATDTIYGSAGSTFSVMASRLGGVPLRILENG